jgi:CheY-like chemotaxis protein
MDILIIGTRPIERAWFEEQTYLFGHEVTACATGKVALEHCHRAFFPLIILTDIDLSDMQVEEFCHRLHTLPREARSMVLIVV